MAFSPTDINGLQLWLRADAGTFNDAAKTQPCADGDAVATWADQSGNGYDFTQATANSRPKYNATDANVECELNNTAVQFMTAHAAFPINQQSF